MGGIAGAAGSIGSSAIQAQAAKQMQEQKIEEYWNILQYMRNQASRDISQRNRRYRNNYHNYVSDFRNQQRKSRHDLKKAMNVATNARKDAMEVIKGPSSDVYGGTREYIPGQGFVYTMAPRIREQFDASIGNDRRMILAGNQIQRHELPRATGEFMGRRKYDENELFQDYLTDALYGDHRARTEAGNKLGLASVRGGNRSDWAEKVQDYLREDSKDRALRIAGARSQARGDALALNQQSDQQAGSNLNQTIDLSSLGGIGAKHGQFAENARSNLTGAEQGLLQQINNIEPQLGIFSQFAASRQPAPMNQSHELRQMMDFIKAPSYSV